MWGQGRRIKPSLVARVLADAALHRPEVLPQHPRAPGRLRLRPVALPGARAAEAQPARPALLLEVAEALRGIRISTLESMASSPRRDEATRKITELSLVKDQKSEETEKSGFKTSFLRRLFKGTYLIIHTY